MGIVYSAIPLAGPLGFAAICEIHTVALGARRTDPADGRPARYFWSIHASTNRADVTTVEAGGGLRPISRHRRNSDTLRAHEGLVRRA